jgi:hypothetical protein
MAEAKPKKPKATTWRGYDLALLDEWRKHLGYPKAFYSLKVDDKQAILNAILAQQHGETRKQLAADRAAYEASRDSEFERERGLDYSDYEDRAVEMFGEKGAKIFADLANEGYRVSKSAARMLPDASAKTIRAAKIIAKQLNRDVIGVKVLEVAGDIVGNA